MFGPRATLPTTLMLLLLCLTLSAEIGSGQIVAPQGYTCVLHVDIGVHQQCNIGDLGPGKTLDVLAAACNKTSSEVDGCHGFNNNGYLKRCVRESCGAGITTIPNHPNLVSCFLTATPVEQPMPPSCGPRPPPAPKPDAPPYGGRCAVTAYQPNCTCGHPGTRPPFGSPKEQVPMLPDFHFPLTEPIERAALVAPMLQSISPNGRSASFRDPQTGSVASLSVGGVPKWGWELLDANQKTSTAVLEHDFNDWSQIVFVTLQGSITKLRKPIGRLEAIRQPMYFVTNIDSDYSCKQDVDPTDWLGRLSANMTGGEEATTRSAISVMAPNTDAGLFGNPEEQNKFVLRNDGSIVSTPWAGFGPLSLQSLHGSAKGPSFDVWELKGQPGCGATLPSGLQFPQTKVGMVGRYLRVVNQGFWWPGSENGTGCGAEVVALSPPAIQNMTTSTALIRLTVTNISHDGNTTSNTTYFRGVVTADGKTLVSQDNLGFNGSEFYIALLRQNQRWGEFYQQGAIASLPTSDQRYVDTAASLLTMYQNLDRGLEPEYGGGKFWNTYNIWLPLDTLALNGALLEWGHTTEALQYLQHFFLTAIASNGEIQYHNFGCDSDADYGRLIDLFVMAVRYSENVTWAAEILPIVHAMATNVIQRRIQAESAFPRSSPLYGIVPGSPEHDICHAPGYFFSINVWFVRGLLSLHDMHVEYPELSINTTLEQMLLPIATVWRADINKAANYTAVRRDDDSGLFFLHPVVGSAYGMATPDQLKPGGNESSCVASATCFASMSAGLPGGGSNQETNYANFRIFSETLLAGILEPEYELAIMTYRESHRGTLHGMTRFRDVLDDMPICGYGKASLNHDRLYAFHNTLAGHSTNYISRGTYWGTEQRQQLDYSVGNETGIENNRWRNDCGDGGEDCSLCMVSSVAPAYWIKWMLVMDSPDISMIYIARGAPRRWYRAQPTGTDEPFGIENAPTRFGAASFSMLASTSQQSVSGFVAISVRKCIVTPPLVSVHLRSGVRDKPLSHVSVVGDGATLVSWFPSNETAVFRFMEAEAGQYKFNFTAM